jgi:tetratricopeptide (TPR) repeat protein
VWIAGIGALVVLIIAGTVLVGRWRTSAYATRIPQPPAVTGQPAVAQHLSDRYSAALNAPTSIAAVGPLCLAYHADMFFDHAQRCYAMAIELDPQNWRWAYYQALIQSERGGSNTLAGEFRGVVAQAPRFGPAWLRLGDAEFKTGNYDAAAAAWRRAAELPEPDAGSKEQGPAYATGSPAHVVEVPVAAHASLGLARIALIAGDADGARQMLDRLTRTNRDFGPAFRLLGDSYRALGRNEDATRAVYRANKRQPFSPYADPMVDALARESRNSVLLLRLASEASLSVNAAWSEYLTRRAAEFDPNNPEVIVKLGRILRTVERNEEALMYFARYHALVPGDFQGLAHIGSCLSALGRYAEAESYFRKALAGLDDPVTHYNMGLLMAVTGRVDDAVRHYELALARDPMHADARSNLAAALARQGKLDRASRELVLLVDQDPENALARTNLGLLLLQRNSKGAREQLEEAIRLDPGMTPAIEALNGIRGG